jgi:hypothetical protein
MITQVFDRIYMLQLPIPFPIKTTNVYFIDDSPRTLIDTGIKTEASLEALRKGMEALGFRLHHIERILITQLITAILSKGDKTPFEIAMDLFPGVPPFEVFLGISEAVGHLEILREKKRVRVTEKEGIDIYSLQT